MQSLASELNRDGRRILLPLLGAAALVLLIACGNVAALLLVRGLQRQQEYAVRSALGMGRVALFRQVSTESLLLAVLGGTIGVGLAFGVVKLFKLIGGHAIPRLDAVTHWLAGAGMGIQFGDSGRGSGRALSRAARLASRPDRGAQERRSEKQRGARGTPAAARSHHGADGADAGAAGGRRPADSHHDEHREGAIRVQHWTNSDHERHRSAGRLGAIFTGAHWSVSRRFPACNMPLLPGEFP